VPRGVRIYFIFFETPDSLISSSFFKNLQTFPNILVQYSCKYNLTVRQLWISFIFVSINYSSRVNANDPICRTSFHGHKFPVSYLRLNVDIRFISSFILELKNMLQEHLYINSITNTFSHVHYSHLVNFHCT
jgi:hypothetical protein